MQSRAHEVVPSLPESVCASRASRPQLARATPFLQRDVHVGGVRLRYVSVGPTETEVGPPLLLVHGLSSRLEEYDAVVPELARGRRVIVPDLPGSGYSDKPRGRTTLRGQEDALLGLLDALGVGEADVGGGSLGGNLSLRLAHREPARVRRVVAWAPAGAWTAKRWVQPLARLPLAHLAFWPLIRIMSKHWYSSAFAGRAAALADGFAYFEEVHERGFAEHVVSLAAEQISVSLFDVAEGIAQPTLLVVGDGDHALGMNAGVHALAKRMPRALLRVFSGGHAIASESPAALAAEAAAFLARGAGDGR